MHFFRTLSLLSLFSFIQSLSAQSQFISIPDFQFRNALIYGDCVDTTENAQQLYSVDFNGDGKIHISEALKVKRIGVKGKGIYDMTGLDKFVNLTYLYCDENYIDELDLRPLTKLRSVSCAKNGMEKLSVNGMESLEYLGCSDNKLDSLSLEGLKNLKTLVCFSNRLEHFNKQGLDRLESLSISFNPLDSLDVIGLKNLKSLLCTNTTLTKLDIRGLDKLEFLYCIENQIDPLLLGGNTAMDRLFCSQNKIKNLDLQDMPNLRILECFINELTALDLHNNPRLKDMFCFRNSISDLNLDGLDSLNLLWCGYNPLTTLNLSDKRFLTDVNCVNNQLTSLDMSNCLLLKKLHCGFNQIDSLHLSNCAPLESLSCENNQLTSLDLRQNFKLKEFFCQNNQLEYLFIKNGKTESDLDFKNNPLSYICCDENQLLFIQGKANNYGLTDCSINSYCSFVPGGVYYTLQGINQTDFDEDGCDSSDIRYPNFKYKIIKGTQSGYVISDNSGAYTLPLEAGNFSVVPQLENPDYYSVDPAQVTLGFPAMGSPQIRDFCISPKGDHFDIETVFAPIGAALPGFNTRYRLVLQNKGNQEEKGVLALVFPDSVLNLNFASTMPDAQKGDTLLWNIDQFFPWDKKVISIEFRLNSPLDTPAVGLGDTLIFRGYYQGAGIDETPDDNVFTFKQIVLGAFDPNDITCLEGNTITPAEVGDYLHYLVRFENTGTYEALNVVIKNPIDPARLDLTSLQIMDSNYPCFARIQNNTVEFIFKDIHLPFTEPGKHGHVLYKIKTKPALKTGDVISNYAEIFFDYNLPVATNNALVTVKAPVSGIRQDIFRAEDAFTLYPNPAAESAVIQSEFTPLQATVLDIEGQNILTAGISSNGQINTFGLPAGVYFVRVLFAEGFAAVQKLVKI